MFEAPIQDILTKRLQQLPALVAAKSLRRDIDELVAVHFHAGKLAVIDDVNISTAYGDLVFRALNGRFEATHITLPKTVQADELALAEIEYKAKRADLLVAVGSGTINDLVKYAAYKAGKPYIIFPTAASMNGYVSANASITSSGHKQSLKAALPLAVLVDMQLVAGAPTRLSQAGLGDSLARSTAQADWLLSHYLTGEAYDDAPYQLITPHEPQVFGQADGIMRGDAAAIESLLTLLLLSGFGMTIAGGSRPASGAEHMIAHAYSMSKAPTPRANLHGEEIALTTLTAARMQEALLARNTPPALHTVWNEEMAAWFDAGTIASFKTLYEKKIVSLRECTREQWNNTREAMAAVHMPLRELEAIGKKAGLPDSAEKLGWDAGNYNEITALTRLTRDRFTCLDVC